MAGFNSLPLHGTIGVQLGKISHFLAHAAVALVRVDVNDGR
jgi:hypothetical protein